MNFGNFTPRTDLLDSDVLVGERGTAHVGLLRPESRWTAGNLAKFFTKQVATIAALKAVSVTGLTTGYSVKVLSYATPGDYGDGEFYYDSASSATENLGTIVAPNSGTGRWLRRHGGIVNPHWFGAPADGTNPDTTAFAAALTACPSGGIVQCVPGKTYVLGALTITKVLTLNFCRSYIKPNTTGVMITLNQSNPDSNADGIVVENGTVIAGPSNAYALIKSLYGTINPTIQNFNVQGVAAQHAYIWNHSGYGMVIRDCKFRNGTVISGDGGAAIWLSHSNGDPLIFSIQIVIDHVDISNIGGSGVGTGLGIFFDGGEIFIGNGTVVEGCTGGGVQHGDTAYCSSLVLDGVHFEQNATVGVAGTQFDFKGGDAGGNYAIRGNRFYTTTITKHIWSKFASVLTVDSNVFYSGGIDGEYPKSLVLINNEVRNTAAGYSALSPDLELSDALKGTTKVTIINPRNRMPEVTVLAGATGVLVNDRPLAGTGYDEWRVVGSYNLALEIMEVFRVFVSRVAPSGMVGAVVIDKQPYETLTLDVAPAAVWLPGLLMAGVTSAATFEIVSQITATIYRIKNRVGAFTLGEILQTVDGAQAADQGAAFPTVAGPGGRNHSSISIVDNTGTYDIRVLNSGSPGTCYYYTTFVGNTRLLP